MKTSSSKVFLINVFRILWLSVYKLMNPYFELVTIMKNKNVRCIPDAYSSTYSLCTWSCRHG